MKQFSGFPARMDFTPVPNVFINRLMPLITNVLELKVTLHLFSMIYRKRGSLRFLAFPEIQGDNSLMTGLKEEGVSPEDVLRQGLDMAVERGTVLRIILSIDGNPQEVYFLNTEADRRSIDKIRSGELTIKGLTITNNVPAADIDNVPNIFTLYEQNIGMLTPMIADELREAEQQYPEEWVKDAIKEAVSMNKRNWRYISRILEVWATKGRGDEAGKEARKADPNKFIKGKYGHMVQR